MPTSRGNTLRGIQRFRCVYNKIGDWYLAWTFLAPEWRGRPKKISDKQTCINQVFPLAERSSHPIHQAFGWDVKTIRTSCAFLLVPNEQTPCLLERAKPTHECERGRFLPAPGPEDPESQMSHRDTTQKASHRFSSDVFSEYPLSSAFKRTLQRCCCWKCHLPVTQKGNQSALCVQCDYHQA